MASPPAGPPTAPTTAQLVVLFFHETPSQAAAVAALVLLAVVSVAQTAVTVKTRLWYMSIVALTGFLEVAGFSARLLMLTQPGMTLFIVHQGLLIISPVLLAVAEYVTAGRLLELAMAASGDASSRGCRAHRRFVSAFFVASDVVCLLLQLVGGALYSRPGSAGMARDLLLAGLGAQLAFFSAFIGVVVHLRLARRWGMRGGAGRSLRPVFACLFTTAGLLHTRNIYRVVEFTMGFDGYLATNERYFYILDFCPVFLALVCFTVLHFGFWLGPEVPAAKALRAAAAGKQPSSGSGPEAVVTISCDP